MDFRETDHEDGRWMVLAQEVLWWLLYNRCCTFYLYY